MISFTISLKSHHQPNHRFFADLHGTPKSMPGGSTNPASIHPMLQRPRSAAHIHIHHLNPRAANQIFAPAQYSGCLGSAKMFSSTVRHQIRTSANERSQVCYGRHRESSINNHRQTMLVRELDEIIKTWLLMHPHPDKSNRCGAWCNERSDLSQCVGGSIIHENRLCTGHANRMIVIKRTGQGVYDFIASTSGNIRQPIHDVRVTSCHARRRRQG